MALSLSATSSIATTTSAPSCSGSSKSSLGGLAQGVSGSSIFIFACEEGRGRFGSRSVGSEVSGRRAGEEKGGWGRGIRGDAVAGSSRGTHRLVRLVVAEILLVPHDVFALGGFPAAHAALDVGHVVPARLPVRGPRDAGAVRRCGGAGRASLQGPRDGPRRRPGVRLDPVARTRRARLRVNPPPNPAATAPRRIQQTRDRERGGAGGRRSIGDMLLSKRWVVGSSSVAKNVTDFLNRDK